MGLSLEAANLPVKNVSPSANKAKSWRYEERSGILVVTELRDANGKYLGTTQTLVRNGTIWGYLARKGYPTSKLKANL